jgi:CheY-like chemotaxis protein
MSSGTLIYHQHHNRLELNGLALRRRELVEARIMGHWISGQLEKDPMGWYLITADKVEIRLRSGLTARFPEVPLSCRVPTKEYPHRVKTTKEVEERKLILLVEDDKSHASMLYQLFRQETRYRMYATSDGQTAWKFLQHVKPNLILVDYLLPQMNGLMLYDHMRAEKALHGIPVVMISAVLPDDEVKKRGIIAFQKPFEIDEFLDLVANELGSS